MFVPSTTATGLGVKFFNKNMTLPSCCFWPKAFLLKNYIINEHVGGNKDTEIIS